MQIPVRAWLVSDSSSFPLGKDTVSVGRNAANDIVLMQEFISSRHCHLIWSMTDNTYRVEDLNSSNGTMVNGKDCKTDTLLKDGDRLAIGDKKASYQYLLERSGQKMEVATDKGMPTAGEPDKRIIVGLIAAILVLSLLGIWVWKGPSLSNGRGFSAQIPSLGGLFQNPWEKALAEARSILAQNPGLADSITADIARASELQNQLEVVDKYRPILAKVDSWRSMRAEGILGKTMMMAAGVDNVYDGVIKVLDIKVPGAGQALAELESLARKVMESRDALGRIVPRIEQQSALVRSFTQSPDRNGLQRLAEESRSVHGEIEQVCNRLNDLKATTGRILSTGESIVSGLQSVADTQVGQMIAGELNQLQTTVRDIQAPLQNFDNRLSDLSSSLAQNDAQLQRLAACQPR